jgi:hypothetical protein
MARFLVREPLFTGRNAKEKLQNMQTSPFYWWWAYLRENRNYRECCERPYGHELENLHHEFGDVMDDDFEAWWKAKSPSADQIRGEYLFAEPDDAREVHRLRSPNDWEPVFDDYPYVVVAFNVSVGISKVKEQLAAYLRDAYDKPRGNPAALRPSSARYKLDSDVKPQAAKQRLDLYKLWVENQRLPRGERDNYETLGRRAGIQIRRRERGRRENLGEVGREEWDTKISKMLTVVKLEIEKTATGKFPLAKKKQSRPKARR